MRCHIQTSVLLGAILFVPLLSITIGSREATADTDQSSLVMPVVEEPGDGTVLFPDANLEAAIRAALCKPTGDILQSELAALTWLHAYDCDIVDLTGLEYCINLTRINLAENLIVDIAPLTTLTHLTVLDLHANRVSDITPIASMHSLKDLDLGENQVTEIAALACLSNLECLDLWGNQVPDIGPLSTLSSLTRLSLAWNGEITDISPLASLTSLTSLGLAYNKVSDVTPLSSLTALELLWLNLNQIEDIAPLASLTSLTFLTLAGNEVSDINPLSSLTALTHLFLSDNSIVTIEPLVNNTGLGDGDLVDLRGNPLKSRCCTEWIPALETRGVEVLHDPCMPIQTPSQPVGLAQMGDDDTTPIPIGEEIPGTDLTVVIKGTVQDADGDQVKLQIELRRLDEYEGEFTNACTQESDWVSTGTEASVTVSGLVPGRYHWQAGAVDENSGCSEWQDFGSNPVSDADFTLSAELALAEKFSPILYLYGDNGEVLDYEPKAAEIMVESGTPLIHGEFFEKWWVKLRASCACTSIESTVVNELANLANIEGFPFASQCDITVTDAGRGLWQQECLRHYFDLVGYASDPGDSTYRTVYQSIRDDYETTTYARIREDTGRIILQYWFFYYFNHWPLSTDEEPASNLHERCRDWDDHEGDWECIQLMFPPDNAVAQILDLERMPEWAVYSTHICHQKTEWDSAAGETQWLRKVDTHPVVYVARGSHANYFQPDHPYDWTAYDLRLYWQEPVDYEYETGHWITGTDVLYGLNSSDSAVVQFHEDPSSQVLLVTDSGFNLKEGFKWMDFAGHWGEVACNLSSGGSFPWPCFGQGANGPVLAGNPAWTNPSASFRDAFPPLHAKRFMVVLEPTNAESTTAAITFGVCDREGNRVGINEVGEIDLQIAGAEYWTYQHPPAPESSPTEPCASADGSYQAILIPGGDVSDQYTVRIEAIDSEEIELTLVVGDQETRVQHTLHYSGLSVTPGSVGEINITPGTDFVMAFDGDGNGTFESNVPPTTYQSISVEVWPVDETPPTPVKDLSVADVSWNACTLEWTVPGDNGSEGDPATYELRYSTSPMTAQTWYSAAHVLDEPRPLAGGESQAFTVDGLSPGTTYYFGLMVGDEVPNWSEVSNIAMGETTTTAEVGIEFETGWNMVSVPVQADDMSASTVFAGSVAVYTWDPETKSYTSPDTIDPKRGYWVAVTEPKTITVTGQPVTGWTDSLITGWNMIGSVHGASVAVADLTTDADPDPLLRNAIYWWNPVTKSYTTVQQGGLCSAIEPGKGYWMAATDACTLTMSPPT
jgi:hypothetical protein